LILRKISKIGATRCQILRINCTKFYFCWGSAPDPAGGAYSTPPDLLAVFNGPTSKGREGEGEEKEEDGKGKGRRREGRGGPPTGESGSARALLGVTLILTQPSELAVNQIADSKRAKSNIMDEYKEFATLI